MGKWAEGKELSNKSWGLLKENKYFLWFPIIGFVISMIPFIILGGGAIFLSVEDVTVWAIVLGIIALVFINFAFTISGAAMVAAVDEELAGRNSSLGYGFGKAFRRLGALFLWSIIQAVVSAILGLLRGNSNGGAAIAGNLLAAIGSAAWSIVTLFVTPFIMLKGQGAVPALKSSVNMVKEKWGTQLTGGVRIGLRLLIVVLPAIALIVGGVVLLSGSGASVSLGLVLLAIGIILLMISAVLGNALRSIFSVALFHFTSGEGAIGPFTAQELEGVLKQK
jgi:hypothetical protein